MQFVVRVDVENAVVRIFANNAMQLLPLPGALQFLRVGFFSCLDLVGLSRWHIEWQVYIHSHEI